MITLPIPDTNNANSLDEKVNLLLDSYYMLRKELEYGLFNLSFENMDKDTNKKLDDGFKNIGDIRIEAESLGIRLSNAEGDITTIFATAQGIETRVSDAEGNISSLQQTASSITSTVSSHTQTINGMQVNISQIEQTATQISSTVASHTIDINGIKTDYSSVVQTVNSITSTVSSHTGQISTLQQTSSSLTSRISSAEGNITTIKQTTDSITLAVNNSKLTFNTSGLTVKNGGLIVTTDGSWEVFKVDTGGRMISRGLYIINPNSSIVSSGSISYQHRTILAATSGLSGSVLIGYNDSRKYEFTEQGTYAHYFRGTTYIGNSSDAVSIKGFAVVFDSNGFLKKA